MSKEQLTNVYKASVVSALKALLTEKHLYQSITVDTAALQTYIEHEQVFARSRVANRRGDEKSVVQHAKTEAEATVRSIKALPWLKSQPSVLPGGITAEGLFLQFPTILTVCHCCDGRWPFNSAAAFEITHSYFPQKPPSTPIETLAAAFAGTDPQTQQLLVLPYQCQQCKGSPVTYMVKRAGQKLTLVGRDPLETIEVPPEIPKGQRKYYSNAVIAHHAGQTLAGLFMLRVFIEQFWRSLQLLAASETRATGDEIGEAYNRTLPPDFKSRFPSLSDIYGKLSAAMHTADGDTELFENCMNRIREHFDARRLYKLDTVASVQAQK